MPNDQLKKVVICDIDGTLIRGETQFFLLVFMFRRGLVSFVTFIKIAWWFFLYRLGFTHGSDRIRALGYGVFAGWTESRLSDLCRAFFDKELRVKIRPDVLSALQKLKHDGFEVIMASATLSPIAEHCCEHVGFGIPLATKMESVSGRLTGRIWGKAVYGEHKLKVVDDFISMNGMTWYKSWAFSDHMSDLPLLLKSETPVVVSPDNHLAKEAEKRQWVIYK